MVLASFAFTPIDASMMTCSSSSSFFFCASLPSLLLASSAWVFNLILALDIALVVYDNNFYRTARSHARAFDREVGLKFGGHPFYVVSACPAGMCFCWV